MKQEGKDINFKHWLGRTIMVSILLLLLVGIIDRYFGIDIMVLTLLTFTVVLIVFFMHEGLHYYRALSLGYKPVWWRTRFRMGFTIETKDNINKQLDLLPKQRKKKEIDDIKSIALFPYYFMVPFTCFLVIYGFIFNYDFLLFAGTASMLIHLYTFRKEGAILG